MGACPVTAHFAAGVSIHSGLRLGRTMLVSTHGECLGKRLDEIHHEGRFITRLFDVGRL